ncbi:long-chain-fatty-acid--CoA ligase 5-like [Strongylocentrotus purpuratus]|uniref:Long-chain-fatty-acid--CoA ligase n=1 Tax=Strongylocentrotus purpuratus TaxID=7668 RepID=A0A7M7SVS7_STRPU|nr:long-chain-fatty-acid--CoA ligase 5-like [Strongylocentrotus purpuratus]
MMADPTHPTLFRPVPLDRQSIVLEGEEGIHISPKIEHRGKECIFDQLIADHANTAYEAFLRGEKVSNDGLCLGWRPSGSEPYSWMSYSEVRKKAQCFGSALLEKGFHPSNESKIGIFSQNRPEWVISDLGCSSYSMISVPLYSTLGPDGYEYIINLTEMKLIVVDTMDKVNSLLDQRSKLPTIKHVVVMERPITDEITEKAGKMDIDVVTFEDFVAAGERNMKDPFLIKDPGKPDDVAVIRFTSGTTGTPKGAMISHANIATSLTSLYIASKTAFSYKPGSRYISYLPLAHGLEHSAQALLFHFGCSIGFFRGDLKELLDDMQELKPDAFAIVPRLANKLFDKIMLKVNIASYLKRSLFSWAFNAKKHEVDKGIFRNNTWYDTFVFGKIQALLGGRVQWMVTGSAPISDQVMTFLRVVFGCTVTEAYGQTEATCASTFTLPNETASEHVGSPLTNVMIKLVDVEEMGYLASQDKGEICMKGPGVFKGYYKNKEKTDETIDSDGWLHSGDIGEWLPNGALKIIDRKKNIYKLSQGEYVAPEKIENVIMRSSLVAQAFVYGESLKSYNIAVIVPEEEELKRFAENNAINGTVVELCENETVRMAIREDVDKQCVAANLCGFEKVKEYILHPEPFSVENGLLTPTFKNKRAAIKAKFKEEIDHLYSNLN